MLSGHANLDEFASRWESDEWVVFHGTSNHAAQKIREEGFSFSNSVYSKVDFLRLEEVFRLATDCKLISRERDYAQLAALNDFRDSDAKPIYFAESCLRAARYASRECAGGETLSWMLSALRRIGAIIDRDQEASVLELTRQQWQTYIQSMPSGMVKPNIVEELTRAEFALAELRTKWPLLADLKTRLESVDREFEHGVVFAVRIEPADRALLRLRGNNGGLEFHGNFPSSRIVDELTIPITYVHPVREDPKRIRFFDGPIFRMLSGS